MGNPKQHALKETRFIHSQCQLAAGMWVYQKQNRSNMAVSVFEWKVSQMTKKLLFNSMSDHRGGLQKSYISFSLPTFYLAVMSELLLIT